MTDKQTSGKLLHKVLLTVAIKTTLKDFLAGRINKTTASSQIKAIQTQLKMHTTDATYHSVWVDSLVRTFSTSADPECVKQQVERIYKHALFGSCLQGEEDISIRQEMLNLITAAQHIFPISSFIPLAQTSNTLVDNLLAEMPTLAEKENVCLTCIFTRGDFKFFTSPLTSFLVPIYIVDNNNDNTQVSLEKHLPPSSESDADTAYSKTQLARFLENIHYKMLNDIPLTEEENNGLKEYEVLKILGGPDARIIDDCESIDSDEIEPLELDSTHASDKVSSTTNERCPKEQSIPAQHVSAPNTNSSTIYRTETQILVQGKPSKWQMETKEEPRFPYGVFSDAGAPCFESRPKITRESRWQVDAQRPPCFPHGVFSDANAPCFESRPKITRESRWQVNAQQTSCFPHGVFSGAQAPSNATKRNQHQHSNSNSVKKRQDDAIKEHIRRQQQGRAQSFIKPTGPRKKGCGKS